jgi:hypothetical protein
MNVIKRRKWLTSGYREKIIITNIIMHITGILNIFYETFMYISLLFPVLPEMCDG